MIAIIDYGMGNLKSVHNAFKYVAPNTESIVTSNPDIIHKADRVVFPGQGAMPDCIREMDEKGLREVVISSAKTKPFLGICIGLQMLFDFSEEGNVEGLGLLKGKVKRFVKKADSPTIFWPKCSLHMRIFPCGCNRVLLHGTRATSNLKMVAKSLRLQLHRVLSVVVLIRCCFSMNLHSFRGT